jgi:hypothetical protein
MLDAIKILNLEDLLLEEMLLWMDIEHELGEGVLVLVIVLEGAPLIRDEL